MVFRPIVHVANLCLFRCPSACISRISHPWYSKTVKTMHMCSVHDTHTSHVVHRSGSSYGHRSRRSNE